LPLAPHDFVQVRRIDLKPAPGPTPEHPALRRFRDLHPEWADRLSTFQVRTRPDGTEHIANAELMEALGVPPKARLSVLRELAPAMRALGWLSWRGSAARGYVRPMKRMLAQEPSEPELTLAPMHRSM
jgi:hypothetical protein